LERVHEDALDMSGLVDNLLSLARAEAGRETTVLSAVDVESLIDASVKEWSPIAERLGVRLLVRTPQQKRHLFVLGDRLSLLRLFRIWLDNACKFTPVGGTITFSASEEADEVLLAVEDTGIGIAPEHQTRVFERFSIACQSYLAVRTAAQASGSAWLRGLRSNTTPALSLRPLRGAGRAFTYASPPLKPIKTHPYRLSLFSKVLRSFTPRNGASTS
jgi:two-component system, OmpR family, sensor histidine kinase CiaH